MHSSPGSLLRDCLRRPGTLVVPGVYDGLSARLAEAAGFEVVHISGGAVSRGLFGREEFGLTTLTQAVAVAQIIASATRLPVIADADNGFGNAFNVAECVTEFERSGVAGLYIEDSVLPHPFGVREKRPVISTQEMVGKIRAALDSRHEPGFIIIARTDSRFDLGLEEAANRARAYAEAGADLVWVEFLRSVEEIRYVASFVETGLVLDMGDEGYDVSLDALSRWGVRLALYPPVAQRAAAKAIFEALNTLRETGNLSAVKDQMLDRAMLSRLLRGDEIREWLATRLGPG